MGWTHRRGLGRNTTPEPEPLSWSPPSVAGMSVTVLSHAASSGSVPHLTKLSPWGAPSGRSASYPDTPQKAVESGRTRCSTDPPEGSPCLGRLLLPGLRSLEPRASNLGPPSSPPAWLLSIPRQRQVPLCDNQKGLPIARCPWSGRWGG